MRQLYGGAMRSVENVVFIDFFFILRRASACENALDTAASET